MRANRLIVCAVSLLAIGMFALPAFAKNARSSSGPNWEAEPLYTTIDVDVNFDDDPRTVLIEAGGDKSAEGIGPKCGGFINWDKPDVDVNYQSSTEAGTPAGDEKLSFYVKANTDTTLVVYTPDRQWVCADDVSESNVNPVITFNRPLAGNYNIWVGTYEQGEAKSAKLFVSELPPPR